MCHLLPPGRPEGHDTGLERRTILYELVCFVFVKTTQVRDDDRNKKGQASNTMALISRQAPSIALTFVCSLLPGHFSALSHFIGFGEGKSYMFCLILAESPRITIRTGHSHVDRGAL